jgi:hypothetical protein
MSRITDGLVPPWPDAERMAKLEVVAEAARESLRGGEHDGLCTNEGLPDSCDLHVAAGKARHRALQDALNVLDAISGPRSL